MHGSYEINAETLAVLPINSRQAQVFEVNGSFLVNQSARQIIDESCRYFGSSYQGRFEGTKGMMGVSYKSPIIVEETRNMIFFPTSSPRTLDCGWISLIHISSYSPKDAISSILFKSGQTIELKISYQSLDNQILRASRLSTLLQQRKVGK